MDHTWWFVKYKSKIMWWITAIHRVVTCMIACMSSIERFTNTDHRFTDHQVRKKCSLVSDFNFLAMCFLVVVTFAFIYSDKSKNVVISPHTWARSFRNDSFKRPGQCSGITLK